MTQLIGQPLPAQMYYLKIYLELMEGGCLIRIVQFLEIITHFVMITKHSWDLSVIIFVVQYHNVVLIVSQKIF